MAFDLRGYNNNPYHTGSQAYYPNCDCPGCNSARRREMELQRERMIQEEREMWYRINSTRLSPRDYSSGTGYYADSGEYLTINRPDYFPSPYAEKYPAEMISRVPKEEPKPQPPYWCQCERKKKLSGLPEEFKDGVIEFKKQWLLSQRHIAEEEVEEIESKHNKYCANQRIEWLYGDFANTLEGEDV